MTIFEDKYLYILYLNIFTKKNRFNIRLEIYLTTCELVSLEFHYIVHKKHNFSS